MVNQLDTSNCRNDPNDTVDHVINSAHETTPRLCHCEVAFAHRKVRYDLRNTYSNYVFLYVQLLHIPNSPQHQPNALTQLFSEPLAASYTTALVEVRLPECLQSTTRSKSSLAFNLEPSALNPKLTLNPPKP